MSSAKTPNRLTDEQDIVCRDFFQKICQTDSIWSQNKATHKRVTGAILNLLGYSAVPGGRVVPIGTQTTFKYGDDPEYGTDPFLYDNDRRLVEIALANDNDTDEAGTSEPSESN